MDQCWSVSGAINLTADNGYMLWTQVYSVRFSIVGEHQAENVEDLISSSPLTARIFGDFEVCRMPGEDRFENLYVCIESGENLRVLLSSPDDNDDPPVKDQSDEIEPPAR
jgi:hypothetical protein